MQVASAIYVSVVLVVWLLARLLILLVVSLLPLPQGFENETLSPIKKCMLILMETNTISLHKKIKNKKTCIIFEHSFLGNLATLFSEYNNFCVSKL